MPEMFNASQNESVLEMRPDRWLLLFLECYLRCFKRPAQGAFGMFSHLCSMCVYSTLCYDIPHLQPSIRLSLIDFSLLNGGRKYLTQNGTGFM